MENEDHPFWNTQPVNMAKKEVAGKIFDEKLLGEYKLVEFKMEELEDVINFLDENYVEDKNSKFRLTYTKEFLKWQIENKYSKPEYALCLKKNDKIVGFIQGRIIKLKIMEDVLDLALINFLCIHRDNRNKRMAPILISEIRKRFNKNGIEKAIFTGGIDLPFKFSYVRYYHHIINIPKLERLGFSNGLKSSKKFRIRENTRLLRESDLEDLLDLYNKEAQLYELAEIHDIHTLKYTFLNREGLVTTLVYEENGKITEFGTIFRVDTSAKEFNELIKTAYLYFHNSEEIVSDLLGYAHEQKYDVFNCLSIKNNSKFFEKFEFYTGTGVLNFYLFNHKLDYISPNQISFYMP